MVLKNLICGHYVKETPIPMSQIIVIFLAASMVFAAIPVYVHAASNGQGSTTMEPIFPVHVLVTNGSSEGVVSPSQTQIFITNATGINVVFSGDMPYNGIIDLPEGRYSFYAQDPEVGFNATVVTISNAKTVVIELTPYTMGYLMNTENGVLYYRPTNASLVAQVVLGNSQPYQLPNISSGSASGYGSDSCGLPVWILYNTYEIGTENMLQGAVYSWGENYTDQVVNSPTPSQYSAAYSYTSVNGGGLSESSATVYSVSSQETLPTAQTWVSPGTLGALLNYDVYMQGTWYDYVYHQYYCGAFDGNIEDDFVMNQGGNFYQYDSSAASTGDYSFSYFYNLAVGNAPHNTVDLTLSTVSTQSQSFSAEVSFSVNAGVTGGDFTGTVTSAGYTSLNSQTASTTVMYALTGYGRCLGFHVYRSGWVLGFSQGSDSC